MLKYLYIIIYFFRYKKKYKFLWKSNEEYLKDICEYLSRYLFKLILEDIVKLLYIFLTHMHIIYIDTVNYHLKMRILKIIFSHAKQIAI